MWGRQAREEESRISFVNAVEVRVAINGISPEIRVETRISGWGVGSPSLLPSANRNATTNANARGGGCARKSTSFWGPTPLVLLSLGIEKTDKFKPTTSRPPALHLRPYFSVSVWRGTEGGGVDAHRKRHLNQDYLTPGNKREGAYGCCLDLIASQNTSEIAKLRAVFRQFKTKHTRPQVEPWEMF